MNNWGYKEIKNKDILEGERTMPQKTIDVTKPFEYVPKNETASTTEPELQPQIITCPYCEGQEIDCLSTEKVTSQLTLFEGAAVQTKTKVKSQDKFVCEKCSATATLSWKEAKDEKEK